MLKLQVGAEALEGEVVSFVKCFYTASPPSVNSLIFNFQDVLTDTFVSFYHSEQGLYTSRQN